MGTSCGSVILAQSICTVTHQSTGLGVDPYNPSAPGVYNDTLTIVDNAANSPQTVALTSTNLNSVGVVNVGVQPVFGTVAAGNTQSIASTLNVAIHGIGIAYTFSLAGADPQDFYFSDANISGIGLIMKCAQVVGVALSM